MDRKTQNRIMDIQFCQVLLSGAASEGQKLIGQLHQVSYRLTPHGHDPAFNDTKSKQIINDAIYLVASSIDEINAGKEYLEKLERRLRQNEKSGQLARPNVEQGR